ncbi:MAG: aminomethyl-transferring glycine dehydrogenase subunit GcvPA [Muribaculaceae bacterium]|nr:aminomethyl-transferring glycine dehydrogenase subunit GcvPA [Muribaculaceae bacterium]MBR3100933.1 aminomethyl-transferring glycine dehydrogenase subunit GcvPA [Muribaculaceae bacterium]
MSYKFFPHTEGDVRAMLERCGLRSLDDLYGDIPSELQLHRDYALPEAMSEVEVRRFFDTLGSLNRTMTCFAGAGTYDHYTPSVVHDILRRSEFLTSYTPYQAEISQGTLQYIFEYQSMMAELTGMEVSNASMYDGATATAEAMMMAVAAGKKRNRVLVSAALNPMLVRVIDTYAKFHGVTVEMIEQEDGVTSRADFEKKVTQPDVAGVIVGIPNFFGIVEDYTGWADICHENKALLIMTCVASTLGVLKTPGEWGADIAVGDGQSLGIPMSFGGPGVGFLCTSKKLIRKMPGRIVGATHDMDGKRTFVLTLQAREQHIRREKATSNICSNQSLMALFVTVYMALMGKKGLREVNEMGYSGAHYLADRLVKSGKFTLAYPDKPFLNEFVVRTDLDIDALQQECAEEGIHAGIRVGADSLLLCVTEMRTKDEIDNLVELLTH